MYHNSSFLQRYKIILLLRHITINLTLVASDAFYRTTNPKIIIKLYYNGGMVNVLLRDVKVQYKYNVRQKNAGYGNPSKVEDDGYLTTYSGVIEEEFKVGDEVFFDIKINDNVSGVDVNTRKDFHYYFDGSSKIININLIYDLNKFSWKAEGKD